MEYKTHVRAEEGKHDLWITRDFDLPVSLLFQAHADPELFEQWMTHEYGFARVVKFEGKANGSWRFETVDAQGNILYAAYGTFHAFDNDQRIIRTFEAENGPYGAQLEYLEFQTLSPDTSRLTMQSIFRSAELRDQLLKLPFAQGLSMAHDRLQQIVQQLNTRS